MSVFDVSKTERVAVFIDGTNTHQSAKSLGYDIDFVKLRKVLKDSCDLRRMFYYTAIQPENPRSDQPNNPLRPLMDLLSFNGYTLVTKQLKPQQRGKPSIELALDAVLIASHIDRVILFSGDSDFTRLVHDLQMIYGLRVSIVSTQAKDPHVSDELRKQADDFIDMTNLKNVIARKAAQ